MDSIHPVSFLRWIPALPFLSAAVIGLCSRQLPRWAGGVLACLSVLVSFCLSLWAFVVLNGFHDPHARIVDSVWTWVESDLTWQATEGLLIPTSIRLGIDFLVDPLSAVMILVVTGVGFLIHVYSLGYMDQEPDSNRYFSHLNLFLAFMLVLVLAENLPLLFVGWEGVGACSYLLIGYYYRDWDKARAGKKAFIVNRIGDAFFVIGILFLVAHLSVIFHALEPYVPPPVTLSFDEINAAVIPLTERPDVHVPFTSWTIPLVALVALCLFLGATGKSAQIPLYVWLPDAMAGPTPVSALIHAATMVTAGVYMVCRLAPLFVASGWVLTLIAYVGAATALVSALIAVRQRDIKKILAYSTISQLGYMFMACGVRAFSFGVFHLFTHAFFKALLFLGAGSVIHAMRGEQDIFKMGGLKRKLPFTYWTFLIGSLALAGIPPLAGFFSKDAILWASYQSPHGGAVLYIAGLITAGLTAFYMFRLMTLVFWSESRVDPETRSRLHESPDTMVFPLVILAFLTLCTGFLNVPALLMLPFSAGHGVEPEGVEAFSHFLAPALHGAQVHLSGDHHALEGILMALTIGLVLGAIVLARSLYSGPDWKARLEGILSSLPQGPLILVENKFYVDEIYEVLVVKPTMAIASFFHVWVDVRSIDGKILHGSASMARGMSRGMGAFQNGDVQRYLIALGLGVLGAVFYLTGKI